MVYSNLPLQRLILFLAISDRCNSWASWISFLNTGSIERPDFNFTNRHRSSPIV